MSLLFNMLPRFVIALLLRSKCLFKCPYIMRLLFKPSVFYDVAPAAKGRVPLTTASRNRSPSPLLGICWHMPWSEDPSLLLKGMIFSRTHSLHCQSARSGLVTALEWSKPWPSTRAFLWSPQKWWEGNPAAGRSRWTTRIRASSPSSTKTADRSWCSASSPLSLRETPSAVMTEAWL